MRLCVLSRYCIPVPEMDSDDDMVTSKIKVDTRKQENWRKTGKKLRKEIKCLRKWMADRRGKAPKKAIIGAQEEVTKAAAPAKVKEKAGVTVESRHNCLINIHQAMAHPRQDGQDIINPVVVAVSLANANSQKKEPWSLPCPTLKGEEKRQKVLSWSDRTEAATMMSDTVCSVTPPDSARARSLCKYHVIATSLS